MLISPDVIGKRFYFVCPEPMPRKMIIPVKVIAGPFFSESIDEKILQIPALLDTGAVESAIDESIASALQLIPVDQCVFLNAHGEIAGYEYFVDLEIAEGFRINQLKVAECSFHSEDVKMLIGMDILGLGEFAHIKMPEERSMFVFRIPNDAPFLAE